MSRILTIHRDLAWAVLGATKPGRMLRETRTTQTPVRAVSWARQRLTPSLRDVYWPIHSSSIVQNARNIVIGVETSPGLMPACYLQGLGGIDIGDYTQVGPHVGIHSNNHDVYENRVDRSAPVRIGAYCWLGMAAQVLAGVTLGDFTIVGAGSVVTHSFPDGYCVIAGSPARIIRNLERDRCVRHRSVHEYHGFVPAAEFEAFRRRKLLR